MIVLGSFAEKLVEIACVKSVVVPGFESCVWTPSVIRSRQGPGRSSEMPTSSVVALQARHLCSRQRQPTVFSRLQVTPPSSIATDFDSVSRIQKLV